MFKRILIANRGEIAVRLIRTCREMNIETVAVYSTADKNSLHVQLANIAVCIGPPKATDSYLNIENILSAAINTACDAIHPGFGFLSENSEFVRLCQESGIKFIGPDAEVMKNMGNKAFARQLMIESKVPVVAGSNGYIKDIEEAKILAKDIGFPLLIKAAAGGGGKGMRRVFAMDRLEAEFNNARAEARACFNDDKMYIEKLLIDPKHIEIQILADEHKNIIHLGERDCSIQRKNQKMIEEAPSTALSPSLRNEIGRVAIRAAKASNYSNAGTIEFVLDENNNYYFIEMNTRIQVEHPVTEMLTGIDIVKEQIRIAAGLKLTYKQEDIVLDGHSIECRINAEDPFDNFRPSIGQVDFLHMAGGHGIRIDTGLHNGCKISPYYDSMLAKIIVKARSRLEAIKKMRRALEETMISNINTNIDFLHLILYHADFMKGTYNTSFIEKNMEDILNWEKMSREIIEEEDNISI